MTPPTLCYYKTAQELKLPVKLLPGIGGFSITLGSQFYCILRAIVPFNTLSNVQIVGNKFRMNALLTRRGFPRPKTTGATKQMYENNMLNLSNIDFPVVAKPTVGTDGGEGVNCNIKTEALLRQYLDKLYQNYDPVLIESFHDNLNSYRVLMFYGKVLAVAQRIPAFVIGDGIQSVSALIDLKNKHRAKDMPCSPDGLVMKNEDCQTKLREQGLSLDSILLKNETITVCYTCNLARGGTTKACNQLICKSNISLLQKASKVLGLDLIGFDVLCENIAVPLSQSKGIILEANSYPDITMHEYPSSGEPTHVSKIILRKLIYRHPISYCWHRLKSKLAFTQTKN